MTKRVVGGFEELVLLSVLRVGEDAYGVRIRQTVEEAVGRPISIGAIYVTLDRLERKGFVTSWKGEARPERGGRAKRYFKVNGAGVRALNEAEAIRKFLATRLDYEMA